MMLQPWKGLGVSEERWVAGPGTEFIWNQLLTTLGSWFGGHLDLWQPGYRWGFFCLSVAGDLLGLSILLPTATMTNRRTLF